MNKNTFLFVNVLLIAFCSSQSVLAFNEENSAEEKLVFTMTEDKLREEKKDGLIHCYEIYHDFIRAIFELEDNLSQRSMMQELKDSIKLSKYSFDLDLTFAERVAFLKKNHLSIEFAELLKMAKKQKKQCEQLRSEIF